MLKKFLFVCLCLFSLVGYAQDTTSTYLKPSQFKINAILLGGSLSYEQRIGNTNTLVFDASLNYSFTYRNSSYFGNEYSYALAPVLMAEGRHYYHFKERLAKNKPIRNNSANFWVLQGGYIFEPISQTEGYNYSNAISLMPGWGIQRPLGKNFSLEVFLAPQIMYSISANEWRAGLGGGLKLGYILK